MLKKIGHLNRPHDGEAPEGSLTLHREGYYLRKGVLDKEEVEALRDEILDVFRTTPPDMREGRTSPADAAMYRYEMYNRSPLAQQTIARAEILSIVEPLLGGDCHIVNCTAWNNPPTAKEAPGETYWHIDGGPHFPRHMDIDWPEHIPFPVFVIATHVFLEDVREGDGPTSCVPGSHLSGNVPPQENIWDIGLSYRGRKSEPIYANAGDVAFFVSDVWHRRLPPAPDGNGRFFLQSNYGRREIAQRVKTTDDVNHACTESIARARTERERQLIGLHRGVFYDG